MQYPGRILMIRKKIPNVIMKKYRYLNTVSNKKKLLFFNNGNEYSNLEEIRLLYNDYISKFNIGIFFLIINFLPGYCIFYLIYITTYILNYVRMSILFFPNYS